MWATGTLALLLALAAPSAAAQIGAHVGALPDRALVAARLAEVDGDPGLSEEERERLAGQYQRVLDHLGALAQANDALARLREEQAAAPAQTAAIRARQDAAARSAETPVALPAAVDLAAVQELLAQEAAAVAAYRDRLAALEQGLADEADALPRWRRELAERRQRALDLDAELAGVQAAGADGREAPARRWLLESERARLRAETQMLELELGTADVRRALTLAQRDEARLALDQALARQSRLQGEEEGRRRDKAERVLAETEAASEAADDAHPRLRELARANAALAEAIAAVDQRTAGVEAARAGTVAIADALAQDFANDRQRINAAGLNRALGRVLIDRRERLPDLRELRRQAAERADAEAEATLAQLHWREELLALQAAIETQFAADLDALEPAEASALRTQLMQTATSQIGLLGLAIAAEERQLRALAELDLAAETLHTLARDYRAFLAEHLLWMRSHVPVTQQSFAALPMVFGELLRPSNWLLVAQTLGDGLADAWTWWGGLIAVALLLAFDRTLRRRIRATAGPLRRARTDRFGYTLWAILWTLLLAAPMSLLFALLGLVLTATPCPQPFPYVVGEALLRIAPGLYYLRA
ncbi:MAG TPA: hypothetical protein VES73_08350, partial [Lamprocystis sp. (in: g-proteobacteria)]|nr:hypothetical protein [Lamprocystis sp. (in: g-proteobacteria)]